MIIIGGGRLEAEDGLSLAAFQTLQKSKNVVFQTDKQALCRAVERFDTLDELYERAAEFDDLYPAISAFLQDKGEDVVFVAVGDGINSGITRQLVADVGRERVQILPGPMSEHILPEKLDGRFSMVSGYEAVDFRFDTDIPTLIYEIDSRILLEEIRLKLQKYYGDEGAVWQDGEERTILTLVPTVPCDLFLPGLHICEKPVYTYQNLEAIVATLRRECPWDREQTHESIRVNLVEECFELLEAIDKGDADEMIEEMGDVLLQVALHNQMEVDTGEVDRDEVTTGICRKMIRRHPHVYGQTVAEDQEAVKTNWEAIKKQEYGFSNQTQALEHVSNYVPSLVRANKLLKKADKFGYHFTEDIYSLFEEFMQKSDDKKVAGKFLLAIVDLFRARKMEPFSILNDACNAFIVDFRRFEAKNSSKTREN